MFISGGSGSAVIFRTIGTTTLLVPSETSISMVLPLKASAVSSSPR